MREELRSLVQLGRVEKDIEISSKLSITVHTLSVLEQQTVVEALPIEDMSEVARYVHLQKLYLTFATSKVNGLEVSQEEAVEFFNALKYSLLADAFTKYMVLSEDQNKAIDALKKK